MIKKQNFLHGQAALILLLIVSVTLGFGLSIISQSTTDVRISKQEQESSRAFNAAEAGIEEALKNITGVTLGAPQSLSVGDLEVDYTVTGENFLEGVYEEGEAAQVILGGVNDNLNIEWVDSTNGAENPGNCSGVLASSGNTAASLLVSIIDNNNEVRRVGINACALGAQNGMSNISTPGSDDYLRSYSLSVTSSDTYVRITPIYNRASVRVTGATLPAQTYLVNSRAQTPTLESKVIKMTRSEPSTPSIFDYVLFSGGNLVK